MKQFLLIVAVVAGLVSCKKNTGNTPDSWILGRWELYGMSGGFRDTIFARGNGNIYQFYSNNTYKKYTASQLSAQGSFRIANLNEENFFMIYFDKDTTGVQLAYQNGMITLGSSAADGPAWTYQRISY